ncbi:MAG TPA: thioredoxin family protein [Candidatus Nanopelagicales bacterium]|nr:thioredoxin family protein [Candidatus Nanopelagicales bacterium]
MIDLVNRLREGLRPRRVALLLGVLGVGLGVRVAVAPNAGEAPCAESAEACAGPKGASAAEGARGGEGLAGKPHLVEFTSGHCPACKRMAPVVEEMSRRCDREAAAAGTIVQVDVDEPEGEALATRYQVRALPTFLGIDSGGAEVTRLVGVQSPEKLATALGAIRVGCPAL